ncbi:Short-chain dehydrogenase/reductase SDR [Gigaspora margarita]|uniref:Short-chain dehydrogenase/reductase SDR n=1 Tax=Gigaspora margarita TaxID=4874 RepID=A0A8H4EQ09_GIGMA|nr:Short-chain dehydrogenase/reductase SDR [Gigaspora margarita]
MDINSLFNVKDKIVLVSGGSRGIGLMIAKGFITNGATVYISSRSVNACDQIAKELSAQGPGKAISLPANLQQLDECKRIIDEIAKCEGKLHILVNNAGATWGAPFDEYPEEAFEKVMNLNVKRVFSLTQAALPLLEKASTQHDPARVINIGSIDGTRVPFLETYAYSASKAALHHLTNVLAGNLSRRNITFNTIAPGPFESKMMAATLKTYGDAFRNIIPLGRIGSPEDIAGTCIYLCSRAGAYTNGATILVDGGYLSSPAKL